MPMQQTETVNLGEIKVSTKKALVYALENIGTSIAVMIYDQQNKIGGVAHVVLPESSLGNNMAEQAPGKYADLAIPALLEEFVAAGGQKRNSTVCIVGGAQLFNFGGGGGNILNIGSRNATAIEIAMCKQELAIEKADIGGNKGKSLRFILATGQILVRPIGGKDYPL